MFAELFNIPSLDAEYNFGKLFRTWVPTPSNDSTWKNVFAPTNSANKDATSYVDLPTTLENHNDPMPSTPSTEPLLFGEQNEYDDLCPFEHLGSWHLIGPNNYDASLPHTLQLPRPRTTTPHYKFPPLASYSPNTLQFWTVSAITKMWLRNGLQETNHNVLAPHFADLPRALYQMINTSFLTGTSYSLTTGQSLPFPQDHFRTKSFHLPEKFTKHYSQHYQPGPPAIHYLLYPVMKLRHFGYKHYTNIAPLFKITSVQGHHTLQATISPCSVPQRGQTGHFTTCVLSSYLPPMPLSDLRRPLGLQEVGGQSHSAHHTHYRRHQKTIRQTIPLGSGNRKGPTECICPPQKEKAVPGWKTNRELLYSSFSPHAELHRQDDLPPTSQSLSTQFGQRRRLRPHQVPQGHQLRRHAYTEDLQSRPGRFFHQHRYRPIHRQLAPDSQISLLDYEYKSR